VQRVEPSAVTKVSALGIEEQRVPVILDVAEASATERLGDGFRVVARITVWEGKQLVAVPVAALFRQGADWAVYVVANGRAALRLVELGRRNAAFSEVTAGLAAGDVVVLHPSDQMADGVAVVPAMAD
jgi:HlyD family secretion protein